MSGSSGRIVYLHALTPIHSGTGQMVDVIDLPIAREKITNWPLIPASSLKGVLRDALRAERGEDWADRSFGTQDAAGTLCFGDQHLLCMPARSYFGTFAYVTAPLALTRFVRDARALGIEPPFAAPSSAPGTMEARLAEGSALARNGKVFLEDLDLRAAADAQATAIAGALAAALFQAPEERRAFAERFALVPDTLFDFLCETGTEIAARVRLEDETKTVARGALWYEEAVPAEAVFWGPVLAAGPPERAREALEGVRGGVVQVGGKSSVGRGLCRMVVA